MSALAGPHGASVNGVVIRPKHGLAACWGPAGSFEVIDPTTWPKKRDMYLVHASVHQLGPGCEFCCVRRVRRVPDMYLVHASFHQAASAGL